MKTLNILATFAFATALLLLTGAPAAANSDGPGPVLMVISNQDFWYQDYADTRQSLEAAGLEVVVAVATTETSSPGADQPRPTITPDLALSDVKAEDYSAIVFSGGWGMAQYQYGFEGTYHNSAYRDERAAADANRLIADAVEQGKYVTAICHGVSVLAWARVDGASPLEGHVVAAPAGGTPGFRFDGEDFAAATVPARWHIETNGARMTLSGSVGDPETTADDVIVDGKIITAENFDAAFSFARELRRALDRQTRTQ